MKILLIENRPFVGFGSNLDVILRATIFLNRMGISDIYYYWENINYGAPGENLFEKYIKKQEKIKEGEELKQVHAIQLAQDLLHHELSMEQNKVLQNMGFFDSELFKKIKQETSEQSGPSIGVHVRSHAHSILPTFNEYIEYIDQIVERHYTIYKNRNLVLVTDRESVVGAYKAIYGNNLKFNSQVFRCPFYLETEHTGWPELTDKENLGLDFLREVYLLSTCTEIIYTGSNLVTIAAAFKPGNYFHLMPVKSRDDWDGGVENIKKLRNGIRKWSEV